MEFNPNNPVVQLCLQGMDLEEKGWHEKASERFQKAWYEASNDFERFMAAHFVARSQENIRDRLAWLEVALRYGLNVDSPAAASALPGLYEKIARCYDELGDRYNGQKYHDLSVSAGQQPADKGPFYHGTRADLKPGDLLVAGGRSNYQAEIIMNHIYFTALVNGAGLAASLAKGQGCERVYIVEPTGSFENDPNVTEKKFPGNPTRSYRSTAALKITGEVTDFVKLTPGELSKWQERLANNQGEIIN